MQPHRLPRNLFAGLATITHSPRGLLCVRKSWAIRNGHEGPATSIPLRVLFRAVARSSCVSRATTLPRSAGRCSENKESQLNRKVRDLHLNVVSIDCNLWLITESICIVSLYHILTFILLLVSSFIVIIGTIYTETSLFFIARLVTWRWGELYLYPCR